MDYRDKYIEMLNAQGRAFVEENGRVFVRNGPRITPVGPLETGVVLTKKVSRKLLNKLGGMWVMTTDGFDNPTRQDEWYAVICRQHQPVDEMPSRNTRSKVRRGLKNCEVRKVSADEIAGNGYETYRAALMNYRGSAMSVMTQEEFYNHEIADAPFEDLRHQWAVYYEGKMVGFTHNLVYDHVEVDYTMIKLHPDYLKYYSSYALIYSMNEYYLTDHGFGYTNDGMRSVLHETGVQDFLIAQLGFEKAYTGLHVYFKPWLQTALHVIKPFSPMVSKLSRKAGAVIALDCSKCS